MKSTYTTSRPVPRHRIESNPRGSLRQARRGGQSFACKTAHAEARDGGAPGRRGIAPWRTADRPQAHQNRSGGMETGRQPGTAPARGSSERVRAPFGADLSAVRIHNDAGSHIAADQEQAIAFTSGRDIYLRRGASIASCSRTKSRIRFSRRRSRNRMGGIESPIVPAIATCSTSGHRAVEHGSDSRHRHDF